MPKSQLETHLNWTIIIFTKPSNNSRSNNIQTLLTSIKNIYKTECLNKFKKQPKNPIQKINSLQNIFSSRKGNAKTKRWEELARYRSEWTQKPNQDEQASSAHSNKQLFFFAHFTTPHHKVCLIRSEYIETCEHRCCGILHFELNFCKT